ncbi:MOB kinase activator-like 2 isoform X1 [Venturia canescens]|uniref:MOB kinase activator-like 2 isoform X1 n=1 Tax=Venturia canescens TaxID=32260 RepID=UPI001C9C284D|nr:MOB kinase activator-like 2 isoform X1 [Venturia canescens]
MLPALDEVARSSLRHFSLTHFDSIRVFLIPHFFVARLLILLCLNRGFFITMFGLGRRAPKYSVIDTSLALATEDTVTCFCRKARRKEKDAGTTEDPKLYLEEAALERQLPELDLRMLVDLPPGLDYNEWLASHTLALFNHINLFYGTISEFCTSTGCPDMTGPGLRTYLWFDEKGKKTRVAAPQYIDYVMTFTQRTVSDETIFPTKYANEFPSSFESIVRKILRLLYHVVAHIYHCHFREVALLGLHAHLNCVFAHLTLLNQRFNLIDPKETEILGDLEAALLGDSASALSQNPAVQETPTTTNT